MKKILLGMIALLAFVFTAQADNIVSGQKYKIVSLDGTKALSCGSKAANDVKLTMNALSDTEQGQVWVFNQNGEYWNITSDLGAFNIDNPSANHGKFENQVVLWNSGSGNNQKWSFVAADDDSYYMVPFENANKCYALDADGKFTFQDKGTDTRVKLVKYVEPVIVIDGIQSGAYYRICTEDGKTALSNNGSAANDRVLTMDAIDNMEEGQIWQITRKGNYWQIKSFVGNVCIDNPAESHSKFSNQVIQWQTSGGKNQQWTFEPVEGGFYYMVPFENAEKCYGYNEVNNTLVFQDKGGKGTKLKLVRTEAPSYAKAVVDGYYALQAISSFPAYNYASEGKFLSFNANGFASLTANYTYAASRLKVQTNENGVTTITLPQADDKKVVLNSNSLKAVSEVPATGVDSFVLFMNTAALTLDTEIAIHAGNTTSAASNTSLSVVAANAAGNGVAVSNALVKNNFNFRLVALPADKDIDKLNETIEEAEKLATSGTLNEEQLAGLKAAITQAKDELNYPYVTKKEITSDVEALVATMAELKTNGTIGKNNTTGIDNAEVNGVSVSVVNHVIVVKNAANYDIFNADGKLQPKHTALPNGAYVVVADGKTFKVAF